MAGCALFVVHAGPYTHAPSTHTRTRTHTQRSDDELIIITSRAFSCSTTSAHFSVHTLTHTRMGRIAHAARFYYCDRGCMRSSARNLFGGGGGDGDNIDRTRLADTRIVGFAPSRWLPSSIVPRAHIIFLVNDLFESAHARARARAFIRFDLCIAFPTEWAHD